MLNNDEFTAKYPDFVRVLTSDILNIQDERMLHGAIGLSTEAGEVLDILKKSVYYGRGIDRTKVIDELGDCLFYIQMMLNQVGVDMFEVLRVNVAKLDERYQGKFNALKANNRDVEAEKRAQEQQMRLNL